MSYTVLARKYRPQSFDDLVGQEHVARTIGNAIAQGRVAHAFLFTGVRGVGKTTTARLLAKSLNCEQGPTATPCNTCGPCTDITVGRDVDVQEIDGASNNSVDDVRRLQESLPFRPARDRFKIVIVDEVHMLSTGAFNAFLKTLEEPPAHVKFIFATTESHKVPITIRSRCQRYDFKLIPQSVVAKRVEHILALEHLEADEATVSLIAREAAGSMRDALTLLDQVVAFGGEKLVGAEVARVLGVAAREQVRALALALVDGDAKAALACVRDAEQQGADALHLGKQLLDVLRDLTVLAVTGNGDDLVDWVAEEREFARALLGRVQPVELQRLFSMATRVVDDVSRSATPMLALEMGLLRVASRPRLGSLEELIARLEQLEARLARGEGGGAGGGGGSAAGGGRPGPRRGPEGSGFSAAPRDEPQPATFEPTQAGRVAPAAPTHVEPAQAGGEPRRAVADERPMPAERVPAERPVAERPPASAASAGTPPGAPAEAGVRRAALIAWEPIVGRMRGTHPSLSAIIEQGEARVVTHERIVLSFMEGSFYGRQASQPDAVAAIAEAALAVLGARPTVEVKLDARADAKARTLADVERTRQRGEQEARRREALDHPVVRDALDVFPDARGRVDVRFDRDS